MKATECSGRREWGASGMLTEQGMDNCGRDAQHPVRFPQTPFTARSVPRPRGSSSALAPARLEGEALV